MAATVYLYVKVPKGFFPQQDTGRLTGTIVADQSTSFEALQQRVLALADIVASDPAVSYTQAYAGGGGTLNTGRMFVNLKLLEERQGSARTRCIARLRPKIATVPGASLYLQPFQDLRVGGRVTRLAVPVHAAGRLLATSSRPGAPGSSSGFAGFPSSPTSTAISKIQGLELALEIDRATASRLGVSPSAIDNTLYDAFGQRQVSTIYRALNQYHVVMEVDPIFGQTPQALDEIRVRSSNGDLVPLSAFAKWAPSTSPLQINHQGQFPSVTISFNLQPGVALGDAVTADRTRGDGDRAAGLGPRQLLRHGAGVPGLA